MATFRDLSVSPVLCSAIASIGWTTPTEIQHLAIPEALIGRDIIALAETGSGKTGAFVIPILDALLKAPERCFALILAPTRELAHQTNDVLEALGAALGVSTVGIVGGGSSKVEQGIALAKRPHIITATPGRLADHLQNTKGFNLRNLKYLVLDEADRMLSQDFAKEITFILAALPRDRITSLYSATMTKQVAKLQKASLSNPVRLEASTKFQTPKAVQQFHLVMPAKWKDCYLAYLMDKFRGQNIVVFCNTCNNADRVALVLRCLGFHAICINGEMGQSNRLGALLQFKSGGSNILVGTDVAARGLDIPEVDMVINFDLPSSAKDYVHRVGRTARAGKAGRALTIMDQYTVESYERLEQSLGYKLPLLETQEESVLLLLERVQDAQRLAMQLMAEKEKRRLKTVTVKHQAFSQGNNSLKKRKLQECTDSMRADEVVERAQFSCYPWEHCRLRLQ